MILRNLAEAMREQNWFTVVLEVLIVVVGIFIGLQVDDFVEQRNREARGARVIEAIRDDINDRIAVQAEFRNVIVTGLAAWEETRARGLNAVLLGIIGGIGGRRSLLPWATNSRTLLLRSIAAP